MKNSGGLKRKTICWIVAVLAQLAVVTGITPAAEAQGGQHDRTVSWQLVDSQVVSPGRTTVGDKGHLVENYVIEARALAKQGNAPIKEGTYTLTLTAFMPQDSMPGQKQGVWHVRGAWTLSDAQASPGELKARHNPGAFNGYLEAELPFNPAAEAGLIHATVKVPPAPGAMLWSSGEGSFSGSEKFEGTLSVNFDKVAGGRVEGGGQ